MKRELPPDRLVLLRPSDRLGLDEARVEALRAQFGDNLIAEHRPKSLKDVAGDTAGDPMLWFLAATSALFALLGEHTDALILLLAVIPLVGMDFYLHRRTEASLQGLSSALAADARAIRDGAERILPAARLVAGDLVRVSAGEPFPADGVVLAGETLQADESSLTGEAYPVAKRSLAHSGGEPLREINWVFAGTRLLTGEAQVRLLFTGSDTLYGEIVHAATAVRREHTPLQTAVARLVRALLLVAVGACAALAAVRMAQGYGAVDAFLSAAVLAVAAIPEEFPVVLTFFLGVGVYRLAQRRALVRRAVAVENIGRVSVICSDKTGTITEGRLALHALQPFAGTSPDRLLEIARMASRPDSHDPLDEALLATGGASGHEPVATFPFTEARRREIGIWAVGEGLIAAAKGAPETILSLCDLGEEDRRRIHADLTTLSDEGQKVIACAWRNVTDGSVEPSSGFRFAGLIGVSDPLREGVREAIATARSAGIRVVMVTGDHPRTAAAVAREAGISAAPVVLNGDELQERLARGERAFLEDLHAVARATPAQKVLLVEVMREDGSITAVTGDGVNDVPALKAADVGVAMGLRGTQSAREVASIILLDDNFSTIVRAIAEGRQLFRNLVLSFAYLLTVHIPLVATAALVPLLGYPLLYLPIHIVILELMIHPAAILGFQRRASEGLAAGGAASPDRFFTRRQAVAICVAGAFMAAAIAGLFVWAIERGDPVEQARAMSLVALASSLIVVFSVLTGLRGTAAKVIASGSALAIALLAATPQMADHLHLHVLGREDWLISVALGALTALMSRLFGGGSSAARSAAKPLHGG